MANEDKKILMQCYMKIKGCLKYKLLVTKHQLKNMVEKRCILHYDQMMKTVLYGKVLTISDMRDYLAKKIMLILQIL